MTKTVIIILITLLLSCNPSTIKIKQSNTSKIPHQEVKNELPSWFFNPPQEDGYLYALGISDYQCDTLVAQKQANERARGMLSLMLQTKNESFLKDYFDDSKQNSEHTNMVIKQHSNLLARQSVRIVKKVMIGNHLALSMAEVNLSDFKLLNAGGVQLKYFAEESGSNPSVFKSTFSFTMQNKVDVKDYHETIESNDSVKFIFIPSTCNQFKSINNYQQQPLIPPANFTLYEQNSSDAYPDWFFNYQDKSGNFYGSAISGGYLFTGLEGLASAYFSAWTYAADDISRQLESKIQNFQKEFMSQDNTVTLDTLFTQLSSQVSSSILKCIRLDKIDISAKNDKFTLFMNLKYRSDMQEFESYKTVDYDGNWFIKDIIPPVITISKPTESRGMKIKSNAAEVEIAGMVTDNSGFALLYINDKSIDLGFDGNFQTIVPLPATDFFNTIILKAVDMDYNESSRILLFDWSSQEKETVAKNNSFIKTNNRYFALIIGINNYTGDWPKLNNAVHDAKGVKEILDSQYRFDTIITLYNQKATRANIITKLEWLSENLNKNDNLLIYYSGHGEFKERLNKGYWVPVDATGKSTVNYISNSAIQTFLNGIPTKHTLLVSDACFSGDIFRGRAISLDRDEFVDMERYHREVYKRISRQAITSGGNEPVMDGGRDGHSVFTYYFLKALKENDQQFFDAGQLYNRLVIPVANNSEQTPIFQPVRNTGDEGGQFIFIKSKK